MNKKTAIMTVSLIVSFVVVTTGLAYALHLGPWAEPSPQTLDLGPVIARVDGAPIHLAEAAARVQGLTSVHGDIESTLGEGWQDDILQSLVDDQILLAKAEQLGIEVPEEDIQAYIDRIEEMVGEGQTLDAWLATQGMTLPELERRAKLQLIGARVYITVTEDITVTGDEVRAYYREHRLEYEEADGTIPSLLELRDSLRESLLKGAQDEAYAAWLQDAREQAEVVVVMDGWWRNL